jgi:hypothetical protein
LSPSLNWKGEKVTVEGETVPSTELEGRGRCCMRESEESIGGEKTFHSTEQEERGKKRKVLGEGRLSPSLN